MLQVFEGQKVSAACRLQVGVPYGSRTRVAAVKGRCPRPLDERDAHGEKLMLTASELTYRRHLLVSNRCPIKLSEGQRRQTKAQKECYRKAIQCRTASGSDRMLLASSRK